MRDYRRMIEMLWNWGLVITADRFCRATLTVTCWLLVLATIAAVFLELNIWRRHESLTGPYPQEAGSQLIVAPIGRGLHLRWLFDTGGDAMSAPSRSAMRLTV